MDKVDSFRMLGRFDSAVEFLLKKYNLGLTQHVSDYQTLLLALAANVNEYDKIFCIRMSHAAQKYVEETKFSTLNQFQVDNQKSIGAQEASFIFRNYPTNYADPILDEHDFLEDMNQEQRQKRKELVRNVILGIALVVVLVVSVIIYNLPYFAEQREFSHVKDEYENSDNYMLDRAVDKYIAQFPNGKNIGEVLYMPVMKVRNSDDEILILEKVDNYLRVEPQGKYAQECKEISDSIWDIEIARYKHKSIKADSKEGVEFVVDMLTYMKNNNVRSVYVTGNPTLDLKEYSEYPKEVRELLEAYDRKTHKNDFTIGKQAKLPDDMVTIKDKITVNDAKKWVRYIITALQNGFDQVLTPGFIEFKNVPETLFESDENTPKVDVKYRVSNQEIYDNVPDIWIHTQTQGNYNIVRTANLFLGITMTFDATFNLPQTNKSYNVTEIGDPGSEDIKGIGSSEVYSKMCQRSTEQFAQRIVDEFGL